MTHEINIYGNIVPFKWYNDGSEFDRADLNKAIDALDLKEGDELIYNIHTFGGCTTTAFAMYNKLKRVKNEKKINLTSRADGYGASSGVILLLAADRKIGSKYLKPFVHNAWTFTMGDKNEMLKVYEELDKVDDAIAELYSEETSITKDEAKQFMNESRDLTLDECLKFGFYTELENVKVVEVEDTFNSLRTANNQLRQNSKNMDNKKDSFWKMMQNFFAPENENETKKVQNKIVHTAEGELDFYDLADDAEPQVGDKARFDGKPAGESNDGKYVAPNGDTYTFSGEELTSIEPKAEEPSPEELENAELKTENETLKDEIKNLKITLEEKESILNKISEAESKTEEPEAPREGKPTEEKPSVRNYFKNIK